MAVARHELEFLYCVAIDFGTARSGFAYGQPGNDELKQGGLQTSAQIKTSSWPGTTSTKTLTNILLQKPDNKYVSFGYTARDRFRNLCDEEVSFFEKFKMKLYGDGRFRSFIQGRNSDGSNAKLEPKTVVGEALCVMKDKALEAINNTRMKFNVSVDDIMWVITVPGMWSDEAKSIMRSAAETHGMGPHNVMLALEPEAASMYIRADHPELRFRDKYIVVDCGGGTVDIACHEIQRDNSVKETAPAHGVPYGSTYLDEEFVKFLKELFGENVIETFRKENPDYWLDLMDSWESAKISYVEYGSLRVALGDLNDYIDTSKCSECRRGNVQVRRKKLVMDEKTMKSLFTPVISKLIRQVKITLRKKKVRGSKWIFLVGGFSESKLLQDLITEAFPAVKLVIPKNPGLAVLVGAVQYGLNPGMISVRLARQTYGIKVFIPFDEFVHPPDKKVLIGGVEKCTDVFDTFVTKGEEVGRNEEKTHVLHPMLADQSSVPFQVFTSDMQKPKYVTDDGCELLGSVTLHNIPLEGGRSRKLKVCIKFGDTELKLDASHKNVSVQLVLEFKT